MKIFDVFDAAREGTFEEFKKFYSGDINQVNNDLDLNLLCMAVTNKKQPDDKLKIIKFLLDEGIDINYTTRKEKRNVLHMFYFCVWRPTTEYENRITDLLIKYGVNINQKDKYGAIPLKYAITLNKLMTTENKEMYRNLLVAGSDYNLKDSFGKTAIDYAKKYSWRNDFLDIVEAFEQSKQ